MKTYISFDKSRMNNPWLARIMLDGKYHHVGRFPLQRDAHENVKRVLDVVAVGIDIKHANLAFFVKWGYDSRKN